MRKIVWYNPPFSKNVETDLGRKFFDLIQKQFPRTHVLYPIINKNTVKLSYSCLQNIGRIISKHNRKILNEGTPDLPHCSCSEGECPVEGKCESTGVVYQATVTQQGQVDKYVGLTERKLAARHKEHYTNFENRNPKNSTSLSRKIWKLDDTHTNYEIKWKILQQCRPYKPGSSECRLCLNEILVILFQPEEATLNSKSEIMGKCRHTNKFKLSKI